MRGNNHVMQLAAYFKLKTGKCLKMFQKSFGEPGILLVQSCAVQHHATTKNIDIQNLETVVKKKIEFYF